MEGEVNGEIVPHFWYKVTPMSASDIHTRRIGLATSTQSALFIIIIIIAQINRIMQFKHAHSEQESQG